MRLPALLFTASLLTTALSAHAEYVTITYSGTVGQVFDAADGPASIQAGSIATFSATFDPARAVAVGNTFVNIDGITGLPVPVPGLRTISIADDPAASYSVTLGGFVFTQADDVLFGHSFGLGAGNFPFVVYNGSQLLGLDFQADVGGLNFYADPVAKMLHYADHTGGGYLDSSDDYGFTVDTQLDAAIAAAPVPEPGTWLLMLAGMAVVTRRLRRR